MDTKDHQTFQQIAHKTARFYAHRCWWADPNELQNEAYLSLLEFYAEPPPTFDPNHEKSRNYAGTVASRHVSRWCFSRASPVSASLRSQRRESLAGLHKVTTACLDDVTRNLEIGRTRGQEPLRVSLDCYQPIIGDMEADVIALEAAALVPELHKKLRTQLHEIYESLFPDETLDMAEACIDVLAENAKSSEAAEEHQVALNTVYRRTERLIYRARHDDMVRDLLTQIREHRGDLREYA